MVTKQCLVGTLHRAAAMSKSALSHSRVALEGQSKQRAPHRSDIYQNDILMATCKFEQPIEMLLQPLNVRHMFPTIEILFLI